MTKGQNAERETIQARNRPALQDQGDCGSVDLTYRQLDGSCNHRKGYGVAGKAVKRYLRPHYQDGFDSPRAYSILGKRHPLPSPRLISMNLHPDKSETAKFTLLVMQFGQLIDHDLTMAPTPADSEQEIKCCGVPTNKISQQCFPIELPSNDPTFKTDCMEFVRSDAARHNNGKKMYPREQTNDLTSFIDASSIYGNNQKTLLKLRTQKGKGALLKTQTVQGKLRLPKDASSDCERTNHPLSYCQMAGDHRVNEQPGLSSIHLVFHLQHNNIVRSLVAGIIRKRSKGKRRPTSQDVNAFTENASDAMKEKLFQPSSLVLFEANSAFSLKHHIGTFKVQGQMHVGKNYGSGKTDKQETRKIMYGIIQKITYCDWLPLVLGPKLMAKYKLSCTRESRYNPRADPRIANVFLTAAFRFGHSLIPDHILVDYEPKGIQDMFNVPDPSLFHFESIVFGMCEGNMSRPFDRFVSHAVTSDLFQTSKKKLDLISLNVQRGRDHGIPSYYHWRKLYGLKRFSRPEEFGKKVAKILRKLFKHPRDIDLFTGGLLEKPVRGGIVGKTFGNILGQQFSDLKYGDAYFFLSRETPQGFTKAQRKSLLRVSIAYLMCSHAGMGLIQKNAFLEMSIGNPLVPCANLPQLDLTPWVDLF